MKNKKLISILSLAVVVANLGVATVFAQTTGIGTQNIGCKATTPRFNAFLSDMVEFEGRSSDFYTETDAVTVGLSNPTVIDDRGFDPAADDVLTPAVVEGTCGNGYSVSIQSAGLAGPVDPVLMTPVSVGGNYYNIRLVLKDTSLASIVGYDAPTSSPNNLGDLITASKLTNAYLTSAGYELYHTSEATSSNVEIKLADGGNLYAAHTGLQIRPDGQPNFGDYNGSIPKGEYRGNITLTVASV